MNYLNLDKKKVEIVGAKLNELLASYHIFYQNLRAFHWNLQSNSFFVLHEKFEELYNDAQGKVDEIAERVLTLRVKPLSRYSEYLQVSQIAEANSQLKDRAMLEVVLKNYTKLIEQERQIIEVAEDANDEGTIDLIGAIIRESEKTCWMISSWLEQNEKSEQKVEMSFN
ncbi:DNA starvation/stationary phase protection protein [Flammeovirgaceae bacterium SG7u.111]|nr:DNA starvation/stationary phase protection protein [Flammeovirgaceae bacterium SG7u.132]WPO34363.1 DNA starvation/stationary phase protection protein [Flammeovirgaceae bacterium SG7u.111]